MARRATLSWPIEPRLLRRLIIGWPAHYAWPPAHNWLRSIKAGMRSHGVAIETREIPRPTTTGTVVLLEAESGRRRERFAIDFADNPHVDADLAAGALLYFKFNHAVAGYPEDNVVPGGYVCGNPVLYRRLPFLRMLRGRPRFAWDVYGRFGLRFPSETRRRAVEILSARRTSATREASSATPAAPTRCRTASTSTRSHEQRSASTCPTGAT